MDIKELLEQYSTSGQAIIDYFDLPKCYHMDISNWLGVKEWHVRGETLYYTDDDDAEEYELEVMDVDLKDGYTAVLTKNGYFNDFGYSLKILNNKYETKMEN